MNSKHDFQKAKRKKKKKNWSPSKGAGHAKGEQMDPSLIPVVEEVGSGDGRYWVIPSLSDLAKAQGEEEEGSVVPQYIFPIVSIELMAY